jgi:hypothetical protein
MHTAKQVAEMFDEHDADAEVRRCQTTLTTHARGRRKAADFFCWELKTKADWKWKDGRIANTI